MCVLGVSMKSRALLMVKIWWWKEKSWSEKSENNVIFLYKSTLCFFTKSGTRFGLKSSQNPLRNPAQIRQKIRHEIRHQKNILEKNFSLTNFYLFFGNKVNFQCLRVVWGSECIDYFITWEFKPNWTHKSNISKLLILCYFITP